MELGPTETTNLDHLAGSIFSPRMKIDPVSENLCSVCNMRQWKDSRKRAILKLPLLLNIKCMVVIVS